MSRLGTTELPAVSVIVPCRRHAPALRRCLGALAAQCNAPTFEVVVVDVESDPEVAKLVGRFAGVRLVRSVEGLTPGQARNLGVTYASGTWLAFTDADCEPEPGWIEAALAGLEAGGRLVGGPVLDTNPSHPVAAADNLLQFVEFVPGRPDGTATHFPGCNMAIRKEDFETVGGFPPYPAGEDLLFCRAVRDRWPGAVLFLLAMRVHHAGRFSLRAMLRHHNHFGFWRGRLRLRIGALQERLGVWNAAILPFAAWRFGFILRRTARWRPSRLPFVLLSSPLLLAGLVAWAVGFRRGLLEARADRTGGDAVASTAI